MHRPMIPYAVVPLLALAGALAAPAAADDAFAKRVEEKAPTVVTVKFVIKVQFGGQGVEREQSGSMTGVIVDPSGVVMMPNWGRGGMRQMKITPVNLRVLFEGDEKEYDAVVGATDSKLGLAFVIVKDLAGKQIASVDLAATADAKVGDELLTVTRLEQGFDYAPYFGLARIVGQVTKPRPMWMLQGFTAVAHPFYAADGKTAGIVIRQSGVTEEEGFGSERTFLLPAKAAATTVAQAVKASQEALAKSKEKEREKEAEPAMAEEPAMDGAAGMEGTPEGMGDQPK